MISLFDNSDCHARQFDTQGDDDLYAQLKALQRQEEFLDIQEEYIKDEMRNLKRELIRAREVMIRNHLKKIGHTDSF